MISMTETEWVASTDPKRMLDCLLREVRMPPPGLHARQGRNAFATDRKTSLFACAVARLVAQSDYEHSFVDEWYGDIEQGRRLDGLERGHCSAVHWLAHPRMAARQPEAAALLRCIFGNPWRPARMPTFRVPYRNSDCSLELPDTSWLFWRDGTVPKMAQAAYEGGDFSTLPILADALEYAGCDNTNILEHCRCLGPHGRGCWTVDLLLGKS